MCSVDDFGIIVRYYNVREYLKMQTACQRCMRLIRHRDYVIKISRVRSARPDPVCLWGYSRQHVLVAHGHARRRP